MISDKCIVHRMRLCIDVNEERQISGNSGELAHISEEKKDHNCICPLGKIAFLPGYARSY